MLQISVWRFLAEVGKRKQTETVKLYNKQSSNKTEEKLKQKRETT